MVRTKNEWPDERDLVVCTIHKVLNYGAFAYLDEYPGKEAFIHISEVSAGWVKNIRDYVRENQKVVARVLRVNPKKGHVDVSLKRIREDQRTRKIQQWKIEQKAEKLLEFAAKSLDKDLTAAYDEAGYALINEFGDLYGAFEAAAEEGADVLISKGLDQEWANAITEIAKKNISPPEVQINGYVYLTSYANNGVEIIREALSSIDEENITIQCVGAPKYRLTVISSDYITAENILEKSAQKAIDSVEAAGGEGEFHRDLE